MVTLYKPCIEIGCPVRYCILTGQIGFRENYGDYFGITVAGYPEAHPEVITDDAEEMERAYQSDLQYLKQKARALFKQYTACMLCRHGYNFGHAWCWYIQHDPRANKWCGNLLLTRASCMAGLEGCLKQMGSVLFEPSLQQNIPWH